MKLSKALHSPDTAYVTKASFHAVTVQLLESVKYYGKCKVL